MYVDNAMVAVLGLMGLVSLLNWGFILISIIYNRSTGVAQTTTDVKDVTFTSSVSEQKQRRPTNPSKGETKTCSNWQKKGRCKKGDQCRFSHEGEIFIKKQNNKKETKKQTTKIDISTTTKEEKAEEDEKHTENNKSKHTMSKETKTKVYYDTEGKELDARFHTTQEHLSDQDLRKLDITTLNPLSPEVSFPFFQF